MSEPSKTITWRQRYVRIPFVRRRILQIITVWDDPRTVHMPMVAFDSGPTPRLYLSWIRTSITVTLAFWLHSEVSA